MPVRERQGMRNGMPPTKTIQLVVSCKGTPWFAPSFPAEQQDKLPVKDTAKCSHLNSSPEANHPPPQNQNKVMPPPTLEQPNSRNPKSRWKCARLSSKVKKRPRHGWLFGFPLYQHNSPTNRPKHVQILSIKRDPGFGELRKCEKKVTS